MIVVGLGPGGWERVPSPTAQLLTDPDTRVVVRTLRHPAAEHLASLRPVIDCDDLYESSATFEDVYRGIVERVAGLGPEVVYAVPGSPLVGEFSVGYLREWAESTGTGFRLIPAESFLDVIWTLLGVDPFREGFQLLNGHELPSPLVLDKPTVIGHLDTPMVLAEVADRIDRVVGPDATVTLIVDAGGADQQVVVTHPGRVDPKLASLRTSMFVPAQAGGVIGVIHAMRRLRQECPWDRDQTHHSLARHLLEESYELIDAIAAYDKDPDSGADADLEEELGDVLLQVLFHAAIAAQDRRFDIDDVGEQLRRKLVRRHPHVFGDVEATDAETVRRNWERIKTEEKGTVTASLLDGVPAGTPALWRAEAIQRRAAKIGFDWPEASGVIGKVYEEVAELSEVLADRERAGDELGDVLFTLVNLGRHLAIDPEVALRSATHRFESRFRAMEAAGPLEGLSPDELETRWEEAKRIE